MIKARKSKRQDKTDGRMLGIRDFFNIYIKSEFSAKRMPKVLILSIAMGANISFEVKNIEIWSPAFFNHNNSSVATVVYFGRSSYETFVGYPKAQIRRQMSFGTYL